MRLVVVGAGDVGGAVAARWIEGGGEAVGLTRTEFRHEDLRAAGVSPSTAEPASVIRPDDAVLLSISGSAGQRAAAEVLRGVSCTRAVLTSSTGVYGAREGRLGADSPAGHSDRAQGVLAAEQAFQAWKPEGVVLRLGGLYRRGRGPREPLRKRGHAPSGPADRVLPLVHRDDAATAILAALGGDHDGLVANVVVQTPTRGAWYALACEILDLPAPDFTPGGAQRTFDVDALGALLPQPRWPDWREGLREALG